MIDTCADAIVLRAYLLRDLGNASARFSSAQIAHLRAIGPGAWQLFLDAEGCSAVAQQKLIELELLDTLSRDARKAVQRRALAEAQRVLAVRHQIAELARIAKKRSLRIVVMRGGVGIAESSDVLHLEDLDVLVKADDAKPLARELESIGYSVDPNRELLLLPPGDVAGGVPVEIEADWPEPHGVDEAWHGTRRLRQCPPLERPGDADHLWDLLFHGIQRHPRRRGRLRDAMVMWRVHSACSVAELTKVEQRIAAHPARDALDRGLLFVRGLNSDAPTDLFAAEAAERYAQLATETLVPLQPWIPDMLLMPAVEYLATTAQGRASAALKSAGS